MDESQIKDKMKLQEILNELANLKKYKNDLANNMRGDKLEQFIDELNKNIVLLENTIETFYDKNYQ